MPLVERLGADVVATYTDPELSGYRRNRPGLARLLEDVRAGRVDVVVCESLDRLARDAEDVNWLFKKLRFDRVRLHPVLEGEVAEVHIAIASALGSMFLSNLKQKTHKGLMAAVMAGRAAGWRAYGYRKMAKLGPDGELVNGLLEIEEREAEVVRSIYGDFAAGLSALAIAKKLNEEGVPGPRGGAWNASTIRGDPTKCVGILNNPLYRGRLVWNRREWRRDPDSDKRERRYRVRDQSEWIQNTVPELRIVNDQLATCVDEELARRALPPGKPPVAQRRRRHLLSGLIKCGQCGANYVISGKDYYRCASQKERGTCSNKVALRTEPLEKAVLSTLRNEMLTEDLAKLFVDEFRRELIRLQRVEAARVGSTAERLRELEREIDNLARNMLEGLRAKRWREC